jgi:hypothetical protein
MADRHAAENRDDLTAPHGIPKAQNRALLDQH